MDLMTFVAACALAFRAELFVPIVTHDGCTTSAAVGTASIPRNTRPNTGRWTTYIAEAARRFDRPEAWVRAVMQAESGGAADATSPAGAIGLMQIMPETYAELRVRYGLGANAYDPHDNIIAGTAYMSEMIELFGVPNFLAAYNAGPARFDDYLQRGRPLPAETQRYLARIGELPAVTPASGDVPAGRSTPVARGSAGAATRDRRAERAICAEVERSACNTVALRPAAGRRKKWGRRRAVRSARARSSARLR